MKCNICGKEASEHDKLAAYEALKAMGMVRESAFNVSPTCDECLCRIGHLTIEELYALLSDTASKQ